MKLFGNKRSAARLTKAQKAKARSAGRHGLTGWQRGLILLACCVVLLCGTAFALYQSFVKPMDRPARPEPEVQAEAEETFRPPTRIETNVQVDEETGQTVEIQKEVPASLKEGFYNILVVGTDDDRTRTDTIMIARLDTVNHTTALLSIPRDTMIESSTLRVPKINGVYGGAGKGENGIKALQQQLAKLLGFRTDAWVMVNLDAFITLVDLVDGVEFDVPQAMHYEDPSQDLHIHLEKGLQHLNGEQAMGLVRFRKGYATQDIMRTQVQQDFIKALAKKCLSVVNLKTLGEMAQVVLENLETDLTIGNLVYFGQELLKCDFDEMTAYTLEGEGVYVDGISYYAPYLHNTLEAVNTYFNPYDAEITAGNVTILTPDYIRSTLIPEEPEEEPEEEVPEELPGENPEENPEERPGDIPENPEEQEPAVPEDPLAGGLPTDDWVVEDPAEQTP